MSDWLLAMLFVLAVFNPAVFVRLLPAGGAAVFNPAVLRRWAPGLGLATLVLALFALLADPILDLLNLSVSTFQIATGTLVVFGALQGFLAVGVRRDDEENSLWSNVALLIWMISPAPITLAIALAAEEGAGFAVAALLVAAAATVALAVLWSSWRGKANGAILGWLGRLFAAAAVLAAIDLVRQGVENV